MGGNPPADAVKSGLQIDAHGGGRKKTNLSMANYAYLDGHVATMRFGDVFTGLGLLDTGTNNFDPYFAR